MGPGLGIATRNLRNSTAWRAELMVTGAFRARKSVAAKVWMQRLAEAEKHRTPGVLYALPARDEVKAYS